MKSDLHYTIFLSVILSVLLILPTYSNAIHNVECKGAARCFTGIITKVKDGDTVVLNKTITIRLSLVDTPEKSDKVYWKRATSFTTQLCLNSIAKFDEDDKQNKGSYKRLVGVVYCNETNLNEALFEEGLAKGLNRFCKKSEFAYEQWATPICKLK